MRQPYIRKNLTCLTRCLTDTMRAWISSTESKTLAETYQVSQILPARSELNASSRSKIPSSLILRLHYYKHIPMNLKF